MDQGNVHPALSRVGDRSGVQVAPLEVASSVPFGQVGTLGLQSGSLGGELVCLGHHNGGGLGWFNTPFLGVGTRTGEGL